MIVKKYILKELQDLDSLYNGSIGNPVFPLYYSKLALMELCGWIEETIDDISRKYVARKKICADCQTIINGYIKSVHSFDSNRVKEILIELVGIVNYDKLEKKLNEKAWTQCQSNLNTLKRMRDDVGAHTFISKPNSLPVIYAPSAIIKLFEEIYGVLQTVDKKLKRYF